MTDEELRKSAERKLERRRLKEERRQLCRGRLVWASSAQGTRTTKEETK